MIYYMIIFDIVTCVLIYWSIDTNTNLVGPTIWEEGARIYGTPGVHNNFPRGKIRGQLKQ